MASDFKLPSSTPSYDFKGYGLKEPKIDTTPTSTPQPVETAAPAAGGGGNQAADVLGGLLGPLLGGLSQGLGKLLGDLLGQGMQALTQALNPSQQNKSEPASAQNSARTATDGAIAPKKRKAVPLTPQQYSANMAKSKKAARKEPPQEGSSKAPMTEPKPPQLQAQLSKK